MGEVCRDGKLKCIKEKQQIGGGGRDNKGGGCGQCRLNISDYKWGGRFVWSASAIAEQIILPK